ncbi:MAG: UDP-N-acetylmuramate dehydrogenase [Fervidobacterium sp.]|nr:UDP-N-acetylmuramate dehydrogenase [Fervidobacterium sp.]
MHNLRRTVLEKLWEYGCDTLLKEELSAHVSFKIGGTVPIFVIPNNVDGLLNAINLIREEGMEFRILGKGTNILPLDGSLPFLVLSTERIDELIVEHDKIHVGAGASFKKLCLVALENELSGLEHAYGLPGSVGGAVYMNAGCYGWETADNILEVTAFDGRKVIKLTKNEINFSYRNSIFKIEKNMVILGATFKFSKGQKEKIKNLMLDTIKKRYEKQPLEYPSAGSVFKRPKPDFYVGTAIESLGLKGFSIGGAQISEKHAGFIINKGNAKAEDVISLIKYIRLKIKERYNIDLETEIEIWE